MFLTALLIIVVVALLLELAHDAIEVSDWYAVSLEPVARSTEPLTREGRRR